MVVLQQVLDWSEFWALIIPLVVLFCFPQQPKIFRPVVIYLWLALFIDFIVDVIWKVKEYYPETKHTLSSFWLTNNNYLYNVHSLVRFACFTAFFIALKQPFLMRVKQIFPWILAVLVVIDFLFFEKFFNPKTFSSRLLATEAGVLLFYCLQYFIYRLQEESYNKERPPDFWVVLGLSIYVVINFFIFLFYTTLIEKASISTALFVWNIHNLAFIVFCIFIAKAFYVSRHL